MPTPTAPELLLPAGSLDKMRTAYDFGADAVYAGQPRYSLRARNNEFRLEQIGQGIREAHARGRRFFVTSNLLPHDDKVRTYLRDIEPVIALCPDALIMADPGLIMMVRERWPGMPIHLSVQANTVNAMAVKFWQRMGLARIILSRELGLDEIAGIRQQCPDIELEVFVHGALCIAYSGRCLLSGYFNRRDANQGTCTNACRWSYAAGAATDATDSGEVLPERLQGDFDLQAEQSDADGAFAACGGAARHPLADRVYLLEEKERPGELLPVMEDEHGTYILNSRDLRAVEHVQRLVAIGVDSLKIEGRTKSRYYVARTAQVYRRAIDDAVAGRPFDPALLTELDGLAHRGYTAGFLQRRPAQDLQNYTTGSSQPVRSQFVGQVVATGDGWAEVETKNRFAVGDRLEIIHPSGNRTVRLERMHAADSGAPLHAAPGSPLRVRIPMDGPADGAMLARLMNENTSMPPIPLNS
ncbi:tRNA 5-hydroxyuridine modification protein YegQ [Paracidovorax konjaci]|uniref:Putative protease n=1 Tax=Paracidovorax konjaci TaxID=32040 RepID=A0A1I1THC2_9BURK|nr:tRNA 5-hydroxyuridine modification protein YegQ [Paracidovorax konjaci]SFD57997.1 putative protease [Paracidovorax konjaci]